MAIEFVKCKAGSKPQRSDRPLCLFCGADIQTGVHPNTKIEEPPDSAPSAPHPQQHFSGSLLPKNNTQWAIICVVFLALGYYLGREHIKYELRDAMSQAFGTFRSTLKRMPSKGSTNRQKVQVSDIDARVTEKNEVFWKYSWKLTLNNPNAEQASVNAIIEFLDSDEFVLANDRQFGLVLDAQEKKTFSGFTLVKAEIAPRVRRVAAKGGVY